MDPQQAAVLQQLNRPGWKVTGQRPEVKSVQGPPDAYGQPSKTDQPTGNIVWVITGPGGQSDEVVVKPPSAPNVPYENPNDPGAKAGAAGFTVVEGPKNNVQQPQATAGWTDVKGITNNGVTTYYGRNPANGKFEMVPGLPTEAQPTTNANKPPSKPSDWQPIYSTPNDTSSRVIALQDPSTGDRLSVPQDAASKIPDGTTKQSLDQGRTVTWVAKGGEWQIQNIGSPLQDPTRPVEGATRRNVQGGMAVTERYSGGQWAIDPSVPPTRFDPNAAKEGDIRPNTDNKGQAIQEVFRGGSWVTDTSVAPKPFGAQPPQAINPGTGPSIVRQDPTTGAISTVPNPNTTDVVARTQQLQEAARTKSSELQQAVQSGRTTPEQAASDFDAWWATNVDPYSQQLQQSQQTQQYDLQTKQRDQQRLEQDTQRAAYSTAQTAGQDAVKNITDTLPYRVGPGYGAALGNVLGAFSSGKAPGPISGEGLTYQMPDLNDIAQKATAEALAHISPTAASIAGRPMPQIPQGFDVAGALNKSNYAPKTTISPDGTVTIDHAPQQPQPQLPPYVPNAGRAGGLDYALPPATY